MYSVLCFIRVATFNMLKVLVLTYILIDFSFIYFNNSIHKNLNFIIHEFPAQLTETYKKLCLDVCAHKYYRPTYQNTQPPRTEIHSHIHRQSRLSQKKKKKNQRNSCIGKTSRVPREIDHLPPPPPRHQHLLEFPSRIEHCFA